MIINPIYLNSKNSEENDWNPYVMEEDKMLDLTDYTFVNITYSSSNSGYVYFLYGDNWNTGIKANANTTLILNMYSEWNNVEYLNALKLVGYNAPPSSYPETVSAQTNIITFTLGNYMKIKLPSLFNGKYLGFCTVNKSSLTAMTISNIVSVAIKDYDT